MDKDNAKDLVCKDGGLNDKLAKLVSAFDDLGFRVMKAETNGVDFELKVRYMRSDED